MATPVLDLDADNSSGAAGTGFVTTFTENGPAVAIADSDVLITNSGGTIYNAVISGGRGQFESLAVNGTLPDGITAFDNGSALILSKAGGASPASFQAALHKIVYSNSSHNPGTTDQTISITVTDDPALANGYSNVATTTIHINAVDDAPVAQDGSFHGSEDTVISNALVATDVDTAQLSYIVVNQPAHGSVTINAIGIFNYTPNTNFNGADSFTFKANDGTLDSNIATISLTVFAVPDAPVITSNGGGDTAAVSIPENSTAVTTNTATDPDGGSISWMIVGGSDRDKFLIDASTGVLSFIPVEVPDFEKPRDSDHNNRYVVQVRAFNGNLSDDQTLTVNVTDVPEPPVITSNGGGDTAAVSIKENDTSVTVVTATDPAGAPITYSIVGGSDGDKFLIDPTVGVLSLNPAFGPDFESPSDSDHNNSYVVRVRAFDGSLADDQTITVNVTDIPGDAPSRLHWINSVDVGVHPAGYAISGIGDFNHDSTSDVLWFNPTTRDTDIWSLSNGHWAGSSTIGLHPAGYQISGIGDFNHDGTSDVLWFNPTTRDTDIWTLNNGHWAASSTIGLHPAGYDIAGIGDFNNDGTSDVLWFNPTTRDTDIWTVINGHWAASTTIGVRPDGYRIAGIGDFNHDGTSDVLWVNPATLDTDIWLVNNGHWAGSTTIGAHPAGYQVAGIGDFNKDGTDDVVWYNPSNNDVDVWLVQNGHWAGSASLGAHPLGSTLAGVGDFDHNGVADIMWRSASDNRIENWMLGYS
jgi:VCBS repeat-containing protein